LILEIVIGDGIEISNFLFVNGIAIFGGLYLIFLGWMNDSRLSWVIRSIIVEEFHVVKVVISVGLVEGLYVHHLFYK